MDTRFQKFIESQLFSAQYEYDKSVNQWTGWLPKLKGVYSQGESIEEVRGNLVEILEEQVFLSISKNKQVKGFSLKIPINA